jgi:hypothetical protein
MRDVWYGCALGALLWASSALAQPTKVCVEVIEKQGADPPAPAQVSEGPESEAAAPAPRAPEVAASPQAQSDAAEPQPVDEAAAPPAPAPARMADRLPTAVESAARAQALAARSPSIPSATCAACSSTR